MLTLAAVDWTSVLVAGVPAYIAAIFAGVAMVRSTKNGRDLRTGNGQTIGHMVRETRERTEDLVTPSGSPIGAVAERAEHLSAVDVALTKAVHAKVADGEPPPPEARDV